MSSPLTTFSPELALLKEAARIVAGFVSRNATPVSGIRILLTDTYASLIETLESGRKINLEKAGLRFVEINPQPYSAAQVVPKPIDPASVITNNPATTQIGKAPEGDAVSKTVPAVVVPAAADSVKANENRPAPTSQETGEAAHPKSKFAATGVQAQGSEKNSHREPYVTVAKSVTDEYLVCLECGKRFEALKRHLSTSHEMNELEYKRRFSLPPNYPMISARYRKERANLARKNKFGNAARTPAIKTAPEHVRR